MMPALTIPSPSHDTSDISPSAPALTSATSSTASPQPDLKTSTSTPSSTDQHASATPDNPSALDRPPESPLSETEQTFPPMPPQPIAKEPPRKKLTPKPRFIDHPAPVPFSETTNSDAIALKSTISILQIQRQKSQRDLEALQRLKEAAVGDPEGFVRELREGKLSKGFEKGDVLGPSLADLEELPRGKPVASSLPVKEETRSDSDDDEDASRPKSKFGAIPQPQNIVRVPPINWDKYHIVGPSLDKLAAEQQKRPNFTKFGASSPGAGLAPEHVIAKPYDPLKDVLPGKNAATQGKRKDSKKPT